MMTKYQLVFIKLETSMYKILANIDTRKRIRVRKAFLKFKSGTFSSDNKLLNKKKYVVEIFRNTLCKYNPLIDTCREINLKIRNLLKEEDAYLFEVMANLISCNERA